MHSLTFFISGILKSDLYFLFSLIGQPFPTFKVTFLFLFLLLSAIFPFIAQHWAMWKTGFVLFCDLRIFDSHFSQFLLHLFNLNHTLRVVSLNIFFRIKNCFCFCRLFLNLWNEDHSMRLLLFCIYDLPIYYFYVFMFCTNTFLQTFLHSLLYSDFPLFLIPSTMSVIQKHTHSLQELNPEKESWNILARVVRLWFVEDYTKGKTPFSMEIVLQDQEVSSFNYKLLLFFDFS